MDFFEIKFLVIILFQRTEAGNIKVSFLLVLILF
jgi:hypothetical protein